MRISQWRDNFKKYIEKLIPISSFDLRAPLEYGEWLCFLPPLSSIGFAEGNANYGTAVQDVTLSIRYRGDTRYIDLPLSELEALLVSLQVRVVREFQSIAELNSLIALTVTNPITVQEYGDGMADWLVTLSIALELGWTPEAEATLVVPLPTPVSKVVTGLYTERLQPQATAPKPPESHLDPTNRDKYGNLVIEVKT